MRIEVWVVKLPNGDRPYTSAAPPPDHRVAQWKAEGGRVFRVWADFADVATTNQAHSSGGVELAPVVLEARGTVGPVTELGQDEWLINCRFPMCDDCVGLNVKGKSEPNEGEEIVIIGSLPSVLGSGSSVVIGGREYKRW